MALSGCSGPGMFVSWPGVVPLLYGELGLVPGGLSGETGGKAGMGAVAGCAGGGGVSLAFGSSGGFTRIVSRLPAPSQVYWRASARSTVTRVTGGEIWN